MDYKNYSLVAKLSENTSKHINGLVWSGLIMASNNSNLVNIFETYWKVWN